jgi:uncharacterized protein (TIGR03643 family)
MTQAELNSIVRMAWEDQTSFDEIKVKTGLIEADVIKIMRQQLKWSSFRRWRARVTGRPAKHRKLLRYRKQASERQSSDHWFRDSSETL